MTDAAATGLAYVEPEPGGGPRLAHFPVTFFAVVMGLAGGALAWQRAAEVLGAPDGVGRAMFWVAATAYAAVLLAYLAKLVRYPAAVRAELHHPVRLAFVPTVTIALLLVAAAGQEVAATLSAAAWWVGTVGQLVLTLYVLTAWISRPVFGMQHVTPAWFIPVVGTLAVPLAGVTHGPVEVSWFFFSIGVVFWAALLPLVFTRLFVHDEPVPARLLPTLAVLIAPPAVAMLALLRLAPDGFGAGARVLYYSALFFGLLFVASAGQLRRLPFFLSWWAYSFPAAALSVSTTVMAREVGGTVLEVLAWTLLAVVSALLAVLAVRTVLAMVGGRVCVPE
ncbi:MAG: SLAC1 anion channel family protein [Actinomycetia bacterium]|jgi:tellurite resistance protein|nr:SLAC1 anion channel family protein [Actinomycetes bacterium]